MILRTRAVPKGRPRIANGHTYTPARTKDFEEQVGWAYKMAINNGEAEEFFDGERLICDIIFSFISTSTRADIDNLVKSVLDGLNGVAYDDDRQVDILIAQKQYGCEEDSIIINIMKIQEG